jgi:rare lipoprotein A
MHALTAAHRTLPFNTLLKVTNLGNGRSIVVRVNDRGPFKEGRIVDLSYEAARRLEMIGPGTALVRLQIVGAE